MYAGSMAAQRQGYWVSRSGALAAIAVLHGFLLLLALWMPVMRPDAPPLLIAVSLQSVQMSTTPIERPSQVVRLEAPAIAVPPPEFVVEVQDDQSLADVQAVEARPPERVPRAMESPPLAVQQPVEVSRVEYLRPPVPRYPPVARRAQHEGVVQLRVLVGEDGRSREMELIRSSGHPLLDDAARQCVGEALFRPYLLNGVPRAVLVVVPIEFTLRRK
jgi:periplasmic protein TonB